MIEILGYNRQNGSAGIRNHVLVMPSSMCAYETVCRIANVLPEAVVIPNQQGCGQIGDDLEMIFRTLAGLGKNPNVGGVLVVGLGCDTISAKALAEEIRKSQKPVEHLIIQEEGGTVKTIEKGRKLLSAMAQKILRQRPEIISINKLILGLECGGSDATSGLAANPALGRASDLFIENGGSVVLSEVTEIIGAEHILASRIESKKVTENLLKAIEDIEERACLQKTDLRGAQPSPGNMAGGLTTLEEKSLGCIYKAGSAPIQDFINYGEAVSRQGLTIMNTPGQDVESLVGMLAGGVQVIAFTTGRGTPVGSPIAPVIKITGNPRTYKMMEDNIDINVGKIIEGSSTIKESGREIFDKIVDVCNGEKPMAEALGYREFSLWRVGFSY